SPHQHGGIFTSIPRARALTRARRGFRDDFSPSTCRTKRENEIFGMTGRGQEACFSNAETGERSCVDLTRVTMGRDCFSYKSFFPVCWTEPSRSLRFSDDFARSFKRIGALKKEGSLTIRHRFAWLVLRTAEVSHLNLLRLTPTPYLPSRPKACFAV